MQGRFDHDRHARLVERLAQPASVGQCLAYADMMDIPPQFDVFARRHFAEHHAAAGTAWRDACPAYALALMVYRSYRLPEDAAQIETLWEELAPSRLAWREAKAIVADVWNGMDRDEALAGG